MKNKQSSAVRCFTVFTAIPKTIMALAFLPADHPALLFKSVLFVLILVWLLVCISLRSYYAGSLVVNAMGLACLSGYVFMGIVGIMVSVENSMIAAIALGIGVGFIFMS